VIVPHTEPGGWPGGIPASRFAAGIRQDSPEGCRVALLGLADDEGVRLNNGRPGAREGPRALRAALASYGSAAPEGPTLPAVFDAGDVVAGGDLNETHRRVTAATATLLDLGLLPVGIGGGHDLTFPFVRAVAARHTSLAGLYFDAHLDVRETAGSGMAFRRLVEECRVRELRIYGMQPLVNGAEHVRWFKQHGGTIAGHGGAGPGGAGGGGGAAMPWPDEFAPSRDGGSGGVVPMLGDVFVSFDLDVLDAAHAPGVSAVNPCGWTPREAEPWVLAAGRSRNVRCFDIMELSPRHDEDGRTARVAAHLLLCFLRGFAERKA
jgi:arginase family enzyme